MNCCWRDLLQLGDLTSDESRVRALGTELVVDLVGLSMRTGCMVGADAYRIEG